MTTVSVMNVLGIPLQIVNLLVISLRIPVMSVIDKTVKQMDTDTKVLRTRDSFPILSIGSLKDALVPQFMKLTFVTLRVRSQ